MELFITKIQNNITLNAIKRAIISVSSMMLVMSFVVFSYYVVNRFTSINITNYLDMRVLYQYFMFLISIIVTYRIFDCYKESYSFIDPTIGTLSVMLLNLNAMINYDVIALPILVIFQSALICNGMYFLDKINFTIKNVPPAVSTTLRNLVSPLILCTLSLTLALFLPSVNASVGEFLIKLTAFMSSYLMIIVSILAISIIWVSGLHGVATISTLLRPFWFYMMLANGLAVVSGTPIPYIGSESFMQWTVWIGGSGCTLGLTFGLRYFAKSNTLKELGKQSINSNLFNINENIIFGVPIVGNKHFVVPFFLAPIMCASIAYASMHLSYVSIPAIVMPWVFPVPLGLFMSSLLDIYALLLSVVLIAVSLLVYYPFLRKYDRELLSEEQNLKNE